MGGHAVVRRSEEGIDLLAPGRKLSGVLLDDGSLSVSVDIRDMLREIRGLLTMATLSAISI